MEWSEIKRVSLYLFILAGMGFVFCWLGPYLLQHSINTWSGSNYNVLLVGDFNPKSPTDASPVKAGFYNALRSRKNSGFQFNTDIISFDESLVDQINGPTETDTKILNDRVKSLLIDKIAGENVVAIVTASSSQTVGSCLEIGKLFNIPVLIVTATETEILNGYGTSGIGFRLVASNKNQVPEITKWVHDITQHEMLLVNEKENKDTEEKKLALFEKYQQRWADYTLRAARGNPGGGQFTLDSVPLKKELDSLLKPKTDSSNKCKTVGILYMPTNYGKNLCAEVKDTLRRKGYTVITFPISNTNSIVYAMKQTEANLAISKWIAICYVDEAENIVSVEERGHIFDSINGFDAGPSDKILFCEAAYGRWMGYHKGDFNFYALHTDSLKESARGVYYSQVGEDTYHILEYCLQNIESTAKCDLRNHLTTLPSASTAKTWTMNYAFWDRTGENMLAKPGYISFHLLPFPDPVKSNNP